MKRSHPPAPPPIRIDLANGWAWCGARRLDLQPRTFALLRHFVENPERLITKDELFATVWADTVVSDAALTSCIRDLRKALEDSSQAPRYVATVHRRGFRFVGPVATRAGDEATIARAADAPTACAAPPPAPDEPFVGRAAELARLDGLFAAAARGERRLVLVSGEAGIGKTTLVEAFVRGLAVGDVRIGRGQCVEQYGVGEPYLPVLEALGRLGRAPGRDAFVQILVRHAPTWLAQLPSLLGDDQLEAVQRRAQGATRERMLREIAEALDAVAADAPLALVLEDLHWCDSATVELLALLARRRDPARLLIVGTYRPADAALAAHPLHVLAHELGAHGLCDEIALGLLDATAVGEYLATRFPGAELPPAFAPSLQAATGGNPLFLVNVVGDLVARGDLRDDAGTWRLGVPVERAVSAVPRSLWQMVERHVERLTPEEQVVLAVGSVAGAEFSAALAPVDGVSAADGERACQALVRRGQLLRAAGVAEWPDGTVAARYQFLHAIYRNVLYARIPAGHRVALHYRVGARLEQAHGARAREVAGELAMHFEEGRDLERAASYRQQAAETALRQHCYREAIDHATHGLALLDRWPAAADRAVRELGLHTVAGAAMIATRGWAAPEVAEHYRRARELSARLGSGPERFPVLLGLWGFYLMRGQRDVACEVTEHLLTLAAATDDDMIRLGTSNCAGLVAYYGGDLGTALGHLERALALYDPERHSPSRHRTFSLDHDSGVSSAAHAAWTLTMLGRVDRAAAVMRQCLAWARATDHPPSLAMACNFAAAFHYHRGETDALREAQEVQLAQAHEHGLLLFLVLGELYAGWLDCLAGDHDAGLPRMRGALDGYRFSGAAFGVPTFLAILAEAYRDAGRVEDGLAVVRDALALAESTGFHYWDAELRRIEGTLLLRSSEADAERAFETALAIARRQTAKSFELRTATDLVRLRHARGDTQAARTLLAPIVDWFTEGADWRDLVEARALLAALDADGAPTPTNPKRTRRGSPMP